MTCGLVASVAWLFRVPARGMVREDAPFKCQPAMRCMATQRPRGVADNIDGEDVNV